MKKMFKRKKNEQGEELENAWDVFIRNYKNVPGFKALVQMAGYAIIFGLIIGVVSLSGTAMTTNKEQTMTTTTTNISTTTTKKIVYNDILEQLKRDNLSIYISVIINQDTFVIDVVNNNNILEGYFESKSGTKKIKVMNGKNYEVILSEEKETPNLFGNIDRDFLIPTDMVQLLSTNRATKIIEEDAEVYNYDINKNNILYEIKVYIKDNNCYKIEINSENSNYLLTYK